MENSCPDIDVTKWDEMVQPKMENIRPDNKKSQYMLCAKHNMVFLEGWKCPDCMKLVRSIFDPW